MQTKRCGRCRENKRLNEFHVNARCKDGLRCTCKACISIARKNRYMKRKIENPAKHELYLAMQNELQKKYQKENPKRMWAGHTINNHKKRGYIINISTNELEELAKCAHVCPICGCKLNWHVKKHVNRNSPSLDRINNGSIITLDAVQILCFECNRTKGDRTMDEFDEYCIKRAKKLICFNIS